MWKMVPVECKFVDQVGAQTQHCEEKEHKNEVGAVVAPV